MTNAPPIPPTVAAARTDQAWRAWALATVAEPTEAEIRVYGESVKELYVAFLWYAQQLHAAGCPTKYISKLLDALAKGIKLAQLGAWTKQAGGIGGPPPRLDPELIWSVTAQLAASTMPGRGFDVY